MFNKLRRAVVALALVAGIFSITPPVPTYADSGVQGLCSFSTWPADRTGQYYFKRQVTGSYYIDVVHGWITARALWPCEGLSDRGWSFAAAANLQDIVNTNCGRCIWQLGYLTEAGNAGDQPYFVYTSDNGNGDYHLITSPRPVVGTRYHFEIVRNGSGIMVYRIKDVNNNILWSRTTSKAWTTGMKFAWWGWEIANMYSAAGLCGGCAHADLVGLYSDSSTSATLPNNFITTYCSEPDGDCNDGTHRHVSGTNNEILNVETHSISQPNG
jgi:hypothetical protein